MRVSAAVGSLSIAVAVAAGAACHSTTAPLVTGQRWSFQAYELTDGTVTCIFGTTLNLTGTNGQFTGSYRDAFLSCSSPVGASSTLLTGTVDAGDASSGTVSFQLTPVDVVNSGEVPVTASAFASTGTIVHDNSMSGTTTVTVTIGGVAHVLTGAWTGTLA